MSNKSNMNTNNNLLNTLIDKVNELPVANTWGGGTEITPGTSNIEIPAYTNTLLTILGDPDLIASNIRSGKNIFGVVGTLLEGVSGVDYGEAAYQSTDTMTITHNLGSVPSHYGLILLDEIKYNTYNTIFIFDDYCYYKSNVLGDVFETTTCTLTETSITFELSVNATNFKYNGTYFWFAFA